MHEDTLGDQVTGVESPDGMQAQVTLLVDMTYQEPDLVHMRGHHHPPRLRPCHRRHGCSLQTDDVAQSVGAYLVDEASHLLAHHADHPVFAARNTWCLTEAFE